jgi:2-methylcitrate dehydratase PrpD
MARFACDLTYSDLPDDLLALQRRSFLDTMGVAAIGATTDMAGIARRAGRALFGAGSAGAARVLMDGSALSPVGAAMAGVFTVDAVDAHDGSTPNKGHAGSAVFPALLAVADALRAQGQAMDGATFAAHLAVAYEVSYRAGQALHATSAEYHASGAWTSTGVAVAVARMLGADADQIAHAAGIGEYHGPRSQMMRCIDHPTMLRDGVGWGAPSGVSAGYLAVEGFTGAPALTCSEPGYWGGLGTDWWTVRDTHYKPYPCCRWAHPAIDAVRDLMRDNGLRHQDIASVDVRTFHYATRLAGHRPANLDDFTYGIAFPVATMIVRGQIGPAELHPETLSDPDIQRVSDATRLIDDPEMTARSVTKRWASVTLRTGDGRVFEAPPRTPRGDSDQPLSDDEIVDKFHLYAGDILGARRADPLCEAALTFDELDVRGFTKLLDLCLAPL